MKAITIIQPWATLIALGEKEFQTCSWATNYRGLVANLLFLDGMKYLKAQNYMKEGYRKDIYPISETTFADQRRRAVANIANSLLINRTLDFVIIDHGRRNNRAKLV